MFCSMCHTVVLGNTGGWQCVCRELNCRHMRACPKCGQNRYQLEKAGQLIDGKPTSHHAKGGQ